MCKDWRGRGKVWLRIVALLAVLVLGAMLPRIVSAHENQVFFRGGGAFMGSNRANELFTDARNPLGSGFNDGGQGYYIGAGLDLLMHKNFLGMEGMSLLGEVGLEFKRFTSKTVTNTGNLGVTTACPIGAPAGALCVTSTAPNQVQITMLTVDVAPKLKFMEKSKLHPWIIPIGLDFHVISPPSNQTNYLDIGVQFGAGLEYAIWGPFNLGVDGRYHLTANMTNTVNNFGTVGAYVGIGF